MTQTPKLAIAIGYIDDDLVTGAIEYMPMPRKKTTHIWKHFVAVAACLCLVVTSVWLSQHQYSEEGFNNQHIGTEEKYRVETFDVSEITEPIKLYAYSVVLPEEIRSVVSQRYPDAVCNDAMYIYDYSEDAKDNYWVPVMKDGVIVDIVFATFNSKGNVITGHSESHVDELNSIAKYTSKDTPVRVITGEYFNYYVIGETAYVSSDISEIENDYIGEIVPKKESVVIEIP